MHASRVIRARELCTPEARTRQSCTLWSRRPLPKRAQQGYVSDGGAVDSHKDVGPRGTLHQSASSAWEKKLLSGVRRRVHTPSGTALRANCKQ
jgi:hypothetical protein